MTEHSCKTSVKSFSNKKQTKGLPANASVSRRKAREARGKKAGSTHGGSHFFNFGHPTEMLSGNTRASREAKFTAIDDGFDVIPI